MATVGSLVVADPPGLWGELGFAVTAGRCRVGETTVELGAGGEGVVGWTLDGAPDLRELAVAGPAPEPAAPVPAHPNGVMSLDHVVIFTPNLDRTVAAFEHSGLRLRRTREAGDPGRPVTQAFFRLGPVIAEVVGPPGGASPDPARFYGLAFTVADLDATARFLGDRLRPARPAVQRGRWIATLDRAAGSTVPIAFMSPQPQPQPQPQPGSSGDRRRGTPP